MYYSDKTLIVRSSLRRANTFSSTLAILRSIRISSFGNRGRKQDWIEIFKEIWRYGDFGFINRYLDQFGNSHDQPILIEYLGYGKDCKRQPDYFVKKLITYTVLHQLGIPVILVCEPEYMQEYIKYFPVDTLMITTAECKDILTLAATSKYRGNIIAAMSEYKPKGGLRYTQVLNLNPELTLGELFGNTFFHYFHNCVTMGNMIELMKDEEKLIMSFK